MEQTLVFHDFRLVFRQIIHHQLIYPYLLVYPGNHNLLIHGLVFPADVIAVKIHVQIIQVPHKGKRLKHIQVVHIKGMLRQRNAAFLQKPCPENNGMHEYIMPLLEMMAFLPGKHPSHRQGMPVLYHLFPLLPLLLIHIIANQHIQGSASACQLPQCVQHLEVRLLLDPVVAVNHLEIKPCGTGNPGIHRSAVSAVGLMDDPDYAGKAGCIFVGYLCGVVLCRAVVHNNDFYVLSSHKQGFDTLSHIVFRIVAGDCHC